MVDGEWQHYMLSNSVDAESCHSLSQWVYMGLTPSAENIKKDLSLFPSIFSKVAMILLL